MTSSSCAARRTGWRGCTWQSFTDELQDVQEDVTEDVEDKEDEEEQSDWLVDSRRLNENDTRISNRLELIVRGSGNQTRNFNIITNPKKRDSDSGGSTFRASSGAGAFSIKWHSTASFQPAEPAGVDEQGFQCHRIRTWTQCVDIDIRH